MRSLNLKEVNAMLIS